MAVTKRQVDVYNSLTNLALKVVITLVLLGMWVYLLFVLIDLLKSDVNIVNKWILGGIEAILTGAVFPMVKHFLPTSKES